MAHIAGTMRPKGRLSAAGGQAQVSPGGTGIVWQQPSITLQDSETTNTPTRVRQFLKKGVVKFQEVSQPLHIRLCLEDLQWCNASLCRIHQVCAVLQIQLLQKQLQATVMCSWQAGTGGIESQVHVQLAGNKWKNPGMFCMCQCRLLRQ